MTLYRAYSVTLAEGRTVRGAVREDSADDQDLEGTLRRAKSDGLVLGWSSERAYAATCAVSDIVRALRPYVPSEPRNYTVVRFYFDARIRQRVIRRGLTLAEAQAHCNDPETSSSTATGKVARARTNALGPWFDGYREMR